MKTTLATVTLIGLMTTLVPAAGPPAADAEAAGASALQRALDTALADERHAKAFYAAVMAKHGDRRPFANIIRAEGRHEQALLMTYERLGLTPPEDRWKDHAFVVPETFAEACDASVVSEVRNARMYDELIKVVPDEGVRNLFNMLRSASIERHLPAFRRHGSGWEPVAPDEMDERQSQQRACAEAARSDMFGALLREMSSTVMKDGPAGAIDVCSDRAPTIAAETAATHGVRIGRTSWKLRNPRNAPPVWAELLVDERSAEPQFMADRNGRLGALAPIRLVSMCTRCHGMPDQLDPAVTDALSRRYPDDQATGFKPGDLRGWFWIEVPANPDGPWRCGNTN